MSQRLKRKIRDIESGVVDSDDSYLNAENALINWGRWTRSIVDPTPRATAKGSSLFAQMKQEYASDSDGEDFVMTSQLMIEAELTEALVLKSCSRRDVDMFRAVYVLNMPREDVMQYMRRNGHKHVHRDSYRRFLDSGLAKLSVMIDENWNVPSSTVILNRGQSADRMEAERAHQLKTLARAG